MKKLLTIFLLFCLPAEAGTLNFTSGNIRFTTITATLADVTDGAWTLAVLFKRDAIPVGNSGIACLYSSGPTVEAGMLIYGSGAGADSNTFTAHPGGLGFPASVTNTTDIVLAVLSKAAGSVVPRLAYKIGSGGAWTHVNSYSGGFVDQIDSTGVEIGSFQNGALIDAHIGFVVWWEGAMSDAHKEALDDNWRTSDLWNSAHGQPKFLMEGNVAPASVVDLAGNATSPTSGGTVALDAGETLASWNFNGIGGGGAVMSSIRRRRQ